MFEHKNNDPVNLLHRPLGIQTNFSEADRSLTEHDLYLLNQTFAMLLLETFHKLPINYVHLVS